MPDVILVTGASGFIGARLTRRLTRDRGERVTGFVHRLGTAGAARLATLPGVRLAHGDVGDGSILDEAMRGCEAVVHCAVDVSSAPSVQEQVNARATRAVIDAARKNAVRHIVFLSTAAVHSWKRPGVVTEDAPVYGHDTYTRSKLEAEALFLGNNEIPVTVIRPTCVYGPFGRTFTVTPITFLRLGIPLVASDNPGRANLIYVDNLVDLILSALDRRPSANRVYLAAEEEPAEWETLYSAYARTIGVPLARYSSAGSRAQMFREEISVSLSNARQLARHVASDIKGPLLRGLATYHRHVPLLQRCDRFVPMGALRKAAGAARSSGAKDAAPSASPPQNGVRAFAPRELREFYSAKATFSADRARRELGWAPRVTAAEALDRTCAWISFAGI